MVHRANSKAFTSILRNNVNHNDNVTLKFEQIVLMRRKFFTVEAESGSHSKILIYNENNVITMTQKVSLSETNLVVTNPIRPGDRRLLRGYLG